MGPTAAGKTDLAIGLAESLDGELISVDSALVYRGLDIGAAKPDYPHHLINIRDPGDPYSAAEFAEDARAAIAAIRQRGRQPILVGGTMLYFRALLLGLDDMPAADPQIRSEIEAEARQLGWPALHAELAGVDPISAAKIHPNHSQRIGRALEVWRQSGRPMSEWQQGGAPMTAHLPLVICPAERAVLHQRIARRLEQMVADGLVGEVARLHARGDLHAQLPAIRAVGYRQFWSYFDGEADLITAQHRALVATRQLAKRQLTWLRSWPGAVWLQTGVDGLVASIEKTSTSAGVQPPASGGATLDTALVLWERFLRLPTS